MSAQQKPSLVVKRRRGSTKYGILFMVTLLLSVVYYSYASVSVTFIYQREVGGHVQNAYEVNTPEAMINELNLTVRGMRTLGLREGTYAAYFPWERTPDRSMAFQYEYIDQLINRTEAVITWRALAYSGNSTPETLGDVYEQKMDNLRSFMTEGCRGSGPCTDWIARDVYLLYYATPFYFESFFGAGSGLLIVMGATLFLVVRLEEYRLKRDRAVKFIKRLGDDTSSIRRYVIVPLTALGLVLMSMPFLFDALGP